MNHLRDFRLWVTCLLTVACTALFGVTFHGALAAPKPVDGPQSPGVTVQAPQHPSQSLTKG